MSWREAERAKQSLMAASCAERSQMGVPFKATGSLTSANMDAWTPINITHTNAGNHKLNTHSPRFAYAIWRVLRLGQPASDSLDVWWWWWLAWSDRHNWFPGQEPRAFWSHRKSLPAGFFLFFHTFLSMRDIQRLVCSEILVSSVGIKTWCVEVNCACLNPCRVDWQVTSACY